MLASISYIGCSAITAQLGFAQMNQSGGAGPSRSLPRGRGGGPGRGRGSGSGRGSGARTPNFNEFAFTYKGAKARRGQGLGFRTPYDDRPNTRSGRAQFSGIDLSSRPLLKPIKFVRSGTLFEDHDEIFKATAPDFGTSLFGAEAR